MTRSHRRARRRALPRVRRALGGAGLALADPARQRHRQSLGAADPLRHGARRPPCALYQVHFGLIPNLGLDALYLALAPLLSAQTVVRLALALAIILPALGAWALHRAWFEKPSPTIWLIPFLSYNVATTGGLLNFAIGIGLAFLALSVVARRGEPLGVRGYVALNLFGAALFFCHIIAWGVFALLFGLMRIATLRAPPREIARNVRLAQALPLALVLLRQSPPSTYSLGGSKLAIVFCAGRLDDGLGSSALALLVGLTALASCAGSSSRQERGLRSPASRSWLCSRRPRKAPPT